MVEQARLLPIRLDDQKEAFLRRCSYSSIDIKSFKHRLMGERTSAYAVKIKKVRDLNLLAGSVKDV